MCKLASQYINQEVECMKFDELSDIAIYDGIWACSSILHVEKNNLPDIILKMVNAVKINGIIYISFKIGDKIVKIEFSENGPAAENCILKVINRIYK